MRPLPTRLLDAAALIAIAGVLAYGHWRVGGLAAVDPDRHYHLAISRAGAEHGRVTALPQLPDIGWDKKFVDKEYLFHVFTTWAYRAGGERGVELLMLLLAFFMASALYALCRCGAEPLTAFAFVAAGALINEWFVYRLMMMRPQVLAIGLGLVVLVALLRRMPVLAAVAALAFALAYHALYVPLGFVAFVLIASPQDRALWRTATAATIGLTVGVLANPYFPGTLELALVGARVGLTKVDDSGVELAPLTTRVFLNCFGPPLALAAAVGVRAIVSPFTTREQRERVIALSIGAFVFWMLAALTPRAGEYAVPLSVAAAAHALADLKLQWRAAVAAGALVLQLPRLEPMPLRDGDLYAFAIVPEAASLPPEAKGKKVLNCAFEEGEVLLWARPDVRAVDVLDPIFLRDAAPELARLREQFREGRVIDAKAVLQGSFHADYVMCGSAGANTMLAADPRFTRLYPPPGRPADPGWRSVYTLIDEPIPAVRHFDVLQDPKPGELDLPAFVDLINLSKGPLDAQGCARLLVRQEELTRFAGAEVAVLGGGPHVELRVDDVPTALLEAPSARMKWNALLVPLAAPVASQRVELKVCAKGGPLAASLSFWSWKDLERWCERRGEPPPAASDRALPADRINCIAPLAAKPFAH